nr:glycosyltransferase family 4 protein [Anaerolineae bacterium]
MLIGIDASRATLAQRTGTEGYSYHLIRWLLELGNEYRFRLYFRDVPSPDLFPDHDKIEPVVIERTRLWTHLGLGPAVRQNPPDVLFVPSHVVPWPTIGQTPAVFTAHDLGYKHYPDKHPFLHRLYLAWSTRHSVGISSRVIAVSHATAHDLVAFTGINREKIRVVYSGIDDNLLPVRDSSRLTELRERLGIKGDYILHVGSIQPRKNLKRLVDAFSLVRQTHPELSLVLAGRSGWEKESFFERCNRDDVAGHVILPGYIADEDLPALYSGALLYVFPSLYEGFGFPALESMACGTPVVCANTSSLPELVGDAALTFAPTDVEALVEAILRILNEESLREKLIARGFERVKQFSWETTARATLDILVEAAGL